MKEKQMIAAVFGAGTMGIGIAEMFASHGHTALLYASSRASAQRHKDALEDRLDRRIRRGKLSTDKKEQILTNIIIAEKEVAADADLVIETIKEDMQVKRQLLTELDAMCKPETIFATNTSALSVTEMGRGLGHPLIGMHFFFPVPAMRLMEVVRGADTPQETFDVVKRLAKELGKELVEVAEAPGFVVNRLIVPMQNEAIHLLEMGVATAEDIDKAMVCGLNHPIGPLTLADLTGLDVVLAIMETLHRETGDPKYRPSLLLRKMVRAGKLGKKTGMGFFDYSNK